MQAWSKRLVGGHREFLAFLEGRIGKRAAPGVNFATMVDFANLCRCVLECEPRGIQRMAARRPTGTARLTEPSAEQSEALARKLATPGTKRAAAKHRRFANEVQAALCGTWEDPTRAHRWARAPTAAARPDRPRSRRAPLRLSAANEQGSCPPGDGAGGPQAP